MSRVIPLWTVCVAASIAIGCAKDVRPIYQKPTLTSDQLSNIKGTVNLITGTTTYVEEVDGARVESGFLIFPVAPSVQVTPGEHTIGVMIAQQSGQYSSTRKTRFKFTFEAGHIYELDRNDLFDARVDLKDKTKGTQIVVE